MEINFKLADNSDAETLLKLIREFHEFEHLSFDENTTCALVKILNEDSLGRVWLLQDGGEAIGYIILGFGYSLEFRGRDAFIDE